MKILKHVINEGEDESGVGGRTDFFSRPPQEVFFVLLLVAVIIYY
jgi:hypothetical protein